MDSRKLNLISGFVAVGSYISILFFFFFYVSNSNIKKVTALEKTTVIELDIVVEKEEKPEVEKKQLQISSKDSQKSKIQSEVVKKSTSVSAKKTTDLKSLFAKVTTKKTAVSQKNITNVKSSSVASRYKSKFEKDKKVEKLSVSSLQKNEVKKQKKVTTSNLSDSKDPYYSKIYQIISSKWSPVVYYDDLKAKVVITISNNGTFSYKFIQYSNNVAFDTQLEEFLKKEMSEIYPANDNGRTSTIEITFEAKG